MVHFIVWWFDDCSHGLKNMTTVDFNEAIGTFTRYRLSNLPSVCLEMYFAGDKIAEMLPYHYTDEE